MTKDKKIVAIMGGGDWYDASVDILEVPKDMNLQREHELYEVWYKEKYCGSTHEEFMTFPQWLKKKGAKEAEVEEFWGD